ncbi:cysteine hydrolase family protein [Aeromicrobium sp.]|uniref:cysteine hydrolase family protein n=1 Tax=Aeromicrobium sp. TaxID=1871063 RepID=UPI0035181CE0
MTTPTPPDADRTDTDPDRSTTALVLIDLQEDFLSAPGLARRRAGLLAAVHWWVGQARRHGAPVVEVRTVLPEDPTTWALNMRDDDSPVALEGTDGAGPVSELADVDTILVTKRRDDAFLGTELLEVLRAHDVDRLLLAGVAPQACVAMTAASAYAHDFRVSLAGGAVASDDDHAHQEALRWLAAEYRQDVREPREGWPTA